MLPEITKEMIKNRSKTDELAKGLTILQVSWMMIQTIGRKIDGLPVTLLELNTLTHIGCAIILSLLWWCKPQSVREGIVIDLSACERCKHILGNEEFEHRGLTLEMPNDMVIKKLGVEYQALPAWIYSGLIALLSLFYGGIHAIAWDAHFPSRQEQIIWRIAACCVAGGAVIMWGSLVVGLSTSRDLLETTSSVVLLISGLLFMFGRLFLLIEAFISVRSLPIGAYDTANWVNFLPHIG
jgi:hypothetical protein